MKRMRIKDDSAFCVGAVFAIKNAIPSGDGVFAESRMVRRTFINCLICVGMLLPFVAVGGADASAAPAPDEVVNRFRIGPFFEYRATREGGTFWAVRPFYSKLRDPVSDTRVTDAVWPLSTFHRDREREWWRVLLAYGKDDDVNDEESAWSAAVFPFWFQGRTRSGEDYWALFPIYGHLPHVLLMDDIDFTLFPLYLNYEINGVEREYYLWPLFSRVAQEEGVTRTSFFPFYGRTEKSDARHFYAFWPFWTSAVYEGDRNPGNAWMLFPLYGRVDRAKEQQRLVIPPFFSHAQTDKEERWRMPWPFIETATAPNARKRSFWPLYGDAVTGDDRRQYAAWPIYWRSTVKSEGWRAERLRVFPFYANETIYKRDGKEGDEYEAERYTRVWPLYSRNATPAVTRLRALELNPIRHSGGIERNWAPFWTFYEYEKQAGRTAANDLLWGILKWGGGRDDTTARDAKGATE